MADVAGWYADTDGTFLLTHMPEADLGEPMLLVRKRERVFRAYPEPGDRLRVADGSVVSLRDLRRHPDWREREVAFGSHGASLRGTLITPAGAGPHPAVVLVHGAAGGQRDFCRLFAQEFLEAGVAALVYDKPGHGRSEGPASPTIFDQADAASAALDTLRAQPELDASRIGLAGFSNGMWAVPQVAARRGDVAFVVGIGSPGVTMAESEVHRRVKVLREAGLRPDALRHVRAAWEAIFSIASAGSADPDVTRALGSALAALAADEQASSYEPADYARNNPMLSPLPPRLAADELAALLSGDPDPELGYDPVADYQAIRCPLLLQFGGRDTSVPAAESVRRVSDALAASPRSSIFVYPDLEHMLNIPFADAGLSAEETMYGFRRFEFGTRALADLRHWLAHAITAQR